MGYLLRITLLLSALWGSSALAQSTRVDTALDRVNELLGEDVRIVRNDEQQLTIIQSTAYGVVQKDHVAAAHLDATAMLWDAQGELLVPCSSMHKHCVKSINFRLDQEKRSSTLRLPAVLHDPAHAELTTALRDLLAEFTKENEFVVTYPRTQRMTEDYLKHDL